MKKGIIFAGGEFSVPENLDNILKDNPCIICADGGYDHAAKLGIVPDIIIGDMDSVENKLPGGVNQIKLNREKDDTDTEACINYLIEKGCREIVLLCALGGRKDHELANIMLTVYALKKGVKLIIASNDTEVSAISDFAEMWGNIGDWLSLIPVLGDAERVTLSGLKYSVQNACIKAGKTVGISNEFIGEKATISVEKGVVVAIKTKR